MEQGWSARESVFESMDGWMNEWMKPFTDCETASLPPSPDRCFSYSNLFPCSCVVAPQGVRILLLVGGGARPTLESWLVLFLNSFHGKGDPNDGKKREWTKGTRGPWRATIADEIHATDVASRFLAAAFSLGIDSNEIRPLFFAKEGLPLGMFLNHAFRGEKRL